MNCDMPASDDGIAPQFILNCQLKEKYPGGISLMLADNRY